MNITLNIQAGSPAELQEAIAGLAGIVSGSVSEQQAAVTREVVVKEEQEKPKCNTRSPQKVEKQQESASENDSEQKEEASTEPEAQTEEPANTEHVPTVVELRAKAQEKGKTQEGKKAIKALLDKFESKSISDVPEEKRAALFTELEAL